MVQTTNLNKKIIGKKENVVKTSAIVLTN